MKYVKLKIIKTIKLITFSSHFGRTVIKTEDTINMHEKIIDEIIVNIVQNKKEKRDLFMPYDALIAKLSKLTAKIKNNIFNINSFYE